MAFATFQTYFNTNIGTCFHPKPFRFHIFNKLIHK